MVAFIDPRQSKVDIVQAIGRAMRKPRGATTKTVGYVLVPLFAGVDGDGLDDAIKTEKFDAIANVLNALQEHDEELIDIIRELKQDKGEGKPFNPKRLLEKVEFLGPQVAFDELVHSIGVEITDRLGVSWDEMYGRLVKFKEREGHCWVKIDDEEDGLKLGRWVSKQRGNKYTLTPERIQRLDEIGFVWDVLTLQWEEGLAVLKQFWEREGHCLVKRGHREDGVRLGIWVGTQRQKKDTLTPERIQRLKEIGFVWDPLTQQWEEGFAALTRFKEREGNCSVKHGHKEDGLNLGAWVLNQRTLKDTLTPERIERLEAIGFVWDQHTQQWEEGLAALERFKEREGHCSVSYLHKEDDLKLGTWVGTQRGHKYTLTPERFKRLEAIGFVWDPRTQNWEEGFAALKRFKDREGDLLLKRGHKEDGLNLSGWVGTQRGSKDTLTPERIQRLEELGFVWDPLTQQWEEGFAALKQFWEREGNWLVISGHKENGIKLGAWVSAQRRNKDTLTPERRQRLDEIGFVWDTLTQQWEEGFAALTRFKEREGNCSVKRGHKEDGLNLGVWVTRQRGNKDALTPERIGRLEAIDFVWDPLTQQWEDNFAALSRFKQREGHCLVKTTHKENGIALGTWVRDQRTKKVALTPVRHQRLEEIGFGWDARLPKTSDT
jgi:DNA-binding TFAR19-related protein (PDSD5 family)